MASWHIRVEPAGKVIAAEPGQDLLGAMARQSPGLLPVGCKGGGCGICKVRVVSGRVAATGKSSRAVLSQEEREAGLVLACRATPESDLVLKLVQRTSRLKEGGNDVHLSPTDSGRGPGPVGRR